MRLSEAHFFVFQGEMMETIYKNVYRNETWEGIKADISATKYELERTLTAHPFFLAQNNDSFEVFLSLALTCNELAVHEDAEFEITILPQETTITIVLTAPCFVFQIRQFSLWQKITLLSSEIIFDTTEERSSKIIVSFDFSQMNDKLHEQFQRLFFQK